VLRSGGAVIVDPADIPHAGEYDKAEEEVLLYEFKADLNTYLAGLGPSVAVHTLKQIIEFNDQNRNREMPFFAQELMHQAEAKGPLTSPGYRKALATCRRLARTLGIDAVMAKHRLD